MFFLMMKAKKIGLVTHPLHGNYGGMLQAYALYTTLETLGVKPRLVTVPGHFWRCLTDPYRCGSKMTALRRLLKDFAIFCVVFFRGTHVRKRYHFSTLWMLIQSWCFRRRFLPHVISPRRAGEGGVDAFVVGSDQVWRVLYARMIADAGFFFLDFASKRQRERSVAYAASFGTDAWEGDEEETVLCRALVRDFRALSVREGSGVDLCERVFGCPAVQMPDPTFLPERSAYDAVMGRYREPWGSVAPAERSSRVLAVYMLDDYKSFSRDEFLGAAGREGYAAEILEEDPTSRQRFRRLRPTVARWLYVFKHADAVVTDSFHGCVFSIIFNKPFVCLGNKGRGSARFETLFQTFGLAGRLVSEGGPDEVFRVLAEPVDWESVNARVLEERRRGLDFLRRFVAEL